MFVEDWVTAQRSWAVISPQPPSPALCLPQSRPHGLALPSVLSRMRVSAKAAWPPHWLLLASVLIVCCELMSASSLHPRGLAGRPFKPYVLMRPIKKILSESESTLDQVMDRSSWWHATLQREREAQWSQAFKGSVLECRSGTSALQARLFAFPEYTSIFVVISKRNPEKQQHFIIFLVSTWNSSLFFFFKQLISLFILN